MTTRLLIGDAIEQMQGSVADRSVQCCVTSPPYFALRADGWWLRSDIVWAKPNPMPESVTDRPSRSHEYVFLLSKRATYYYDHIAIRREAQERYDERPFDKAGGNRHGDEERVYTPKVDKQRGHSRRHEGFNDRWDAMSRDEQMAMGANERDVWTIPTRPFKGAHFATFPWDLAERCIKAGTSPRACPLCGAPWARQTDERSVDRTELPPDHPEWRPRQYKGKKANGLQPSMGADVRGKYRQITTTGWEEGCDCEYPEPVKCTVLDPFAGAGTTGMVAEKLGRDAILIELNPEYAQMSDNRITDDNPLFNQVTRENNA